MKPFVLFIALLLFIPSLSLAKRKINRTDENGKKTGWWISYWDKEKKVKSVKSYFKEGLEQRVSKNYSSKGKKLVKFRYYKNRIRVKYFDEEGKLTQKGWAKIDYSQNDLHYFWHGKWKFYNEFRTKIKESIYANGHLLSEKSFVK